MRSNGGKDHQITMRLLHFDNEPSGHLKSGEGKEIKTRQDFEAKFC